MNAIATEFKGVKYKSRIEADMAWALDRLGHQFKYEPKSFLLPSGIHYMPDFWVPDIKLWVEVRGYNTQKGESQIQEFGKMIMEGVFEDQSDYLVIKKEAVMFAEDAERFGYNEWMTDVWVSLCYNCHKYSFIGLSGCYQCRACGIWSGKEYLEQVYLFYGMDELKDIITYQKIGV